VAAGVEMLRYAQHDRRARAPTCHPERSEGSVVRDHEMLRCAQHDTVWRFKVDESAPMADTSAMGAMNRPLRVSQLIC